MTTGQVLDEATNVGFVFIIASVKPEAPATYRSERMRLYLAQNGEPEVDTESGRFLLMLAPAPAAPLAEPDSHPAISSAMKQQHEARMACALQSVDRQTPLLAGESVERDEFNYLTAQFNGCPERTPVLRRTTNYGELLYLFPGVTVGSTGRLLFRELPPSGSTSATRSARVLRTTAITTGSVATFIAKGLASGMVGAVGGAIMNSIIEQIFPPGVPSYFDQVYAQIEKIVGAQLQQATIDQVNGAINNIKIHLTTEYKPAKVGKDLNRFEDRKFLFDLLQKYETTYLSGPGGMLGTLMADNYAKVGYGAFLLGAGLHLALYQEMANVDPSNKRADGTFRGALESSYGRPTSGTVATTAAQYAAFAEKVWPQLLVDRAAKIRQTEKTLCAFGDSTGGSCRNYAWFRDDLDVGSIDLPGQWPSERNKVNQVLEARQDKDGKNPGLDQLMREYNAYKDQKANDLKTSLNDPLSIAANWKLLVATPIKVA